MAFECLTLHGAAGMGEIRKERFASGLNGRSISNYSSAIPEPHVFNTLPMLIFAEVCP